MFLAMPCLYHGVVRNPGTFPRPRIPLLILRRSANGCKTKALSHNCTMERGPDCTLLRAPCSLLFAW
jgi:hypothetical protein